MVPFPQILIFPSDNWIIPISLLLRPFNPFKISFGQLSFIQYCSYLVEKIFGQDQGLDPVTADYLIYEEAGRFSLLLLRWVERGMKESPEKMAKMMEQIEVNLTK